MGELEKPVARVLRRLRFQRFVTTLVWTLALTLLLLAIVLGLSKAIGVALPGPEWGLFAIAVGLGVVIAFLVAIFGGPGRLDAAVAIDRAFDLRERLSTALTLPAELHETPAGKALLADAARRVADLDVTSAFGIRLPRRAWVVLIPAALAVSMLFVPTWVQGTVQARTETKVNVKALTKGAQALTKKISGQRQVIDKEKFPEVEKLLAQIEKKAEDLAKTPPAQKDRILIEMNKLADALKERQKQLGSPDQVNRQLQQLKEVGQNGPADRLARELARGDFKKAAEQLKDLQEKLQKGEMAQAEKKALQDQLAEMSQKLKEIASMEERKKQLEQGEKNGGLSKEQYEREMEKLKQQSKSLQQLQQLAGELGQAQESLQKGNAKQAAESLGMTRQQLDQMAKQLDEMESLERAMADVMDCKNGLSEDGMNQLGDVPGGTNGGDGMRRGTGNGPGRGRGEGDRPEAPRRDRNVLDQGPAADSQGQSGSPGVHPARQDGEGPEHDRHSGRDRRRDRRRCRRALEPENPQERRNACSCLLRSDQSREVRRGGISDDGSQPETRRRQSVMSVFIATPEQTEIVYPESDGQPIGENTVQFHWIVLIKQGLESVFRDRGDVFVAGDLFWYPVEGNPKIRVAPDAMVVMGRPPGHRRSYLQWKEEGIAPQVVFEVQSPGNRTWELEQKLLFYETHGVQEYYLYDPEFNELWGWRRQGSELVGIGSMNGWKSPLLGIGFDLTGPELRIVRPDGHDFVTYAELEEQRDQITQERDQITQERDLAQQQVERLAARLRELGVDPEA